MKVKITAPVLDRKEGGTWINDHVGEIFEVVERDVYTWEVSDKQSAYCGNGIDKKYTNVHPRKLFGGVTTLLDNATPEKNRAIAEIAKNAGYELANGFEKYSVREGNTVGYGAVSGTLETWSTLSSLPKVSFEKFVLEILNPQTETTKTVGRVGGNDVVVSRDGTVEVGCKKTNVDMARAIVKAYEELNGE